MSTPERAITPLENRINADVARIRNVAQMLMEGATFEQRQSPELLPAALKVASDIVANANAWEQGQS